MKGLVFGACLLGGVAFGQVSLSLIASKDVALGYHDNFNTENNNYSNATQFAAYVNTGASGGLNVNRAIISFDLTELPLDSDIISAKLSLYAFDDYVSSVPMSQGHHGNNSCYIQMITEDWSETGVTWNSQPSTSTQNQAVLAQSTDPHQNYTDIDVTAIYQYFSDNRDQNFGLKFGLINEVLGNNLSFHSSESSDFTKHPKLEIVYKRRTNDLRENDFNGANLILFPNPTSNELTVVLDKHVYSEMNILNSEGKIVDSFQIEGELENKIDLSSYESGIYFVAIETKKLRFVVAK